jgi:hypothetical protein
MELRFLVILIGLLLLILYHFFEAWGTYEFEPFAYKFGIQLKKITLKTNIKTFDMLKKDFYRIDNTNYKIISKNICLVRLGSKEMPLIMYFRPIPLFSYKINIKNEKYIITLKISFLYLIIIGFFVYNLINTILSKQKILFDDLYPLIFYTLLFVFLIIMSICQMKRVAINFIKILKNNN